MPPSMSEGSWHQSQVRRLSESRSDARVGSRYPAWFEGSNFGSGGLRYDPHVLHQCPPWSSMLRDVWQRTQTILLESESARAVFAPESLVGWSSAKPSTLRH